MSEPHVALAQRQTSPSSLRVALSNSSLFRKQRVGDYELGETIATSKACKVKIGRHVETNQKVAIKMYKKKLLDYRENIRAFQEIRSLQSLRHPNIVHLIAHYNDKEHVSLVLEYVEGGDLFDCMTRWKEKNQRLPITSVQSIIRQVAHGLLHCHASDIAHRDIKLDNILVSPDLRVKIADFGLSSPIPMTNVLNTACGSITYAAPELLAGTPYEGPPVDVWALGVVLYSLAHGHFPFEGCATATLHEQILAGRFAPPPRRCLLLDSLLAACFAVHVPHRITLDQFCRHRWLLAEPPAEPAPARPAEPFSAPHFARFLLPLSALRQPAWSASASAHVHVHEHEHDLPGSDLGLGLDLDSDSSDSQSQKLLQIAYGPRVSIHRCRPHRIPTANESVYHRHPRKAPSASASSASTQTPPLSPSQAESDAPDEAYQPQPQPPQPQPPQPQPPQSQLPQLPDGQKTRAIAFTPPPETHTRPTRIDTQPTQKSPAHPRIVSPRTLTPVDFARCVSPAAASSAQQQQQQQQQNHSPVWRSISPANHPHSTHAIHPRSVSPATPVFASHPVTFVRSVSPSIPFQSQLPPQPQFGHVNARNTSPSIPMMQRSANTHSPHGNAAHQGFVAIPRGYDAHLLSTRQPSPKSTLAQPTYHRSAFH